MRVEDFLGRARSRSKNKKSGNGRARSRRQKSRSQGGFPDERVYRAKNQFNFPKRILRKPVNTAEVFEKQIEEKMKQAPETSQNEIRKNEKAVLHQAIDEQLEERRARMN